MAACGYTWEYVDNFMTIPKLAALKEFWKLVPPLPVTLAAIARVLGVDFTKSDDSKKLDELKSLAAHVNAGAK